MLNTNRNFADKDKEFFHACCEAGIPPTKRQASKYRNKMGKAYKVTKEPERESRRP